MDADKILTEDEVQGITDLFASIDYLVARDVYKFLAERAVLLDMLQEVEPNWATYNGMGYCVDCCRLTDAAGYRGANPEATLMPHEEDCIHLLIAQVLQKAGRSK